MLKSNLSSESARLCSIGNEFLSIVKLPQAIRCTWRLSEAVPIAARDPDLFFPVVFLQHLLSLVTSKYSKHIAFIGCHFPDQLSQGLLNCLRLC